MSIKVSFISILAMALMSCGEPKFDYLFVKNDTNMQLTISAQFNALETKLTPLVLAPGEEDGWRFTGKERKLVERFQNIQIQTSECELLFNNQQLKTMILKGGVYRLVLNSNDINC